MHVCGGEGGRGEEGEGGGRGGEGRRERGEGEGRKGERGIHSEVNKMEHRHKASPTLHAAHSPLLPPRAQ